MTCNDVCDIKSNNKLLDADCNPVPDLQPSYVSAGVQAELHLPRPLTDYGLPKLTENCIKYKSPESQKDIPKYIKEYNVDWTVAEECQDIDNVNDCANKFDSKNDFFIRKVSSDYFNKYMHKNITDSKIISPAECRCVIYDSESKAKNIWIKGDRFSVKSLLNLEQHEQLGYVDTVLSAFNLGSEKRYRLTKINSELVNRLSKLGVDSNELLTKNISVIISRLAPQDYHRFHSPVSGKILHIDDVNGNYYSVQPAVVNSKTNVFGRNKRVNVWIKTLAFGIVVMSIIGATCVGTISLTLPNNIDTPVSHEKLIGLNIKHGQQLGFFEFGGSTIVTVVFGDVVWCPKILDLSEKKIESYVHVGEYLGEKK